MLIATHNINGIRASLNRGWDSWCASRGLDLIALQEIRCQPQHLPSTAFRGYVASCDLGSLPGRNGVAILTHKPPVQVRTLTGSALQILDDSPQSITAEIISAPGLEPFALEGRYLEVDLADYPLRVGSLYIPKGAVPAHHARPSETVDEAKYERKMAFLAAFAKLLKQSKQAAATQGREYLVLGDFNIAHTRQDLRNWKTNQRSEGFLPEEREWFSSILGADKMVDVVREQHPSEDGPYSWWSWRGQSFKNNVGWRIDYHLASPGLAKSAQSAFVDKETSYESRLSDHAPVIVDYAM